MTALAAPAAPKGAASPAATTKAVVHAPIARPAHSFASILLKGTKTPAAAGPPTLHRFAEALPKAKTKHDRNGEEHDPGEKKPKAKRAEPDPTDPAVRQMASMAPPAQMLPVSAAAAAEAPRARMSMEELLPSLVKKIAWAGDRNKGSVRLELGAGRFAGTTLVVHADNGKLRVEVSGSDADALRPLLDERLRRSGLDVESVT